MRKVRLTFRLTRDMAIYSKAVTAPCTTETDITAAKLISDSVDACGRSQGRQVGAYYGNQRSFEMRGGEVSGPMSLPKRYCVC
jgi:hypothetical protein